MHTTTILFKKKDHTIPEDLLSLVIAANPSGHGVVAFAEGSLDAHRYPGQATLEWVNDIQAEGAFKDTDLLFVFNNFPNGTPDDDLQPFVVLEDEQQSPLVAAVLDGEFSNFAHASVNHTNEFFAVHAYLMQKIGEMYEDSDKNVDKLFEKIKRASFQQEMYKMGLGKQSFFLMLGDGTILNFSKDMDTMRTCDWGIASHTYGWGEEAKAGDNPIIAPKPESKLSKLAALGAKAKVTTVPAVSPKPDAPAVPAAASATAKTTEQLKSTTAVPTRKQGRPDEKYKTRQDVNWWYAAWNEEEDPITKRGVVPQNAVKRPLVYVLSVPRKFDEKGKLVKEDKQGDAPKPQTTPTAPPAEPAAPDVVSPNHPLIPANERGILDDMWKAGSRFQTYLDSSSHEIEDPEKIAADVKKWPSFAEQRGLAAQGLSIFDKFRKEDFEAIVVGAPESAAIILLNFRNDRLLHKANVKKTEADTNKPSSLSPPRSKLAALGAAKR